MTTYVIGDVQGCAKSLFALLREIKFRLGIDKIIFAGDMVNRGPRSLETLQFIISLGSTARCVLGNHDVYMLMCASGSRKMKSKDTFDKIINSDDAADILLWLAHQPLILQEQGFTVVHAGLLPQWTVAEACKLGNEFSQKLISLWQKNDMKLVKKFFTELWNNEPDCWSNKLNQNERYRITVNAMTRIRAVDKKGKMDFTEKGGIAGLSDKFYPWFAIPDRKSRKSPIICGHWSAIGLMLSENVSHIDTGCVWGRKLTAIRLPDRQIFQVDYCD